MKGFINLIETQDTCCVILYGEVGDWGDANAATIVRELLDAEAAGKKIDVRINSVGGDVYSGIAIFNTLRQSKAEVTIYIDCIAASIASVIAACGKPVMICGNGRMMIHRVKGGAYGNAEDIEQRLTELRALEDLLCEIYATRTGVTAEAIRATYFDGKDHWLTAAEAVALGFADEIYDDPSPLPAEVLHGNAERMSAEYTNRYYNSLQKQISMSLFERFKTRAGFEHCADDEAFINRIAELETSAAEAATLRAENKTLKEANDAYREGDERARNAAHDAEVDAAHTENRIRDNEVESFKALMRQDATTTRTLLAARQPKQRIVATLEKKDDDTASAWENRMAEINTNTKNKK